MKLRNFVTTALLALTMSVSLAACDSGDDGGSDEASDNADNADNDDSSANPPSDDECSTFCVAYVEICLNNGTDTTYPDNDTCFDTCKSEMVSGSDGDTTGNSPQCRFTMIQNQMCEEAGANTTMCN